MINKTDLHEAMIPRNIINIKMPPYCHALSKSEEKSGPPTSTWCQNMLLSVEWGYIFQHTDL